MEKTKKILKTVGNVIGWIFVAVAVFITIVAFTAQNDTSGSGLPNVKGTYVLNVLSDSMSPTFKKGDLIIGKAPQTATEVYDLPVGREEGAVVTFRMDINGDGKIEAGEVNSHRLVGVAKWDDDGHPIEFYTQGDNRETNKIADKDTLDYRKIICVWTGTKIPVLGSVIDFLKSGLGFLLCIVLPLFLFFLYELFRFVMAYLSVKQEKKAAEAAAAPAPAATLSAEEEEEIKRRAIEEYLRKQAEAQAATPPPSDEPPKE